MEMQAISIEDNTNAGCLGVVDVEEQINCLSVNSYKPNLLVSGGASVLIHNFERGFDDVATFSPSHTTFDSITTAVCWNYKVPHIFASASENGTTTIWDLKNKKSIMSLTDPKYALDSFSAEGAKGKKMSICWHPANPTQIAIGCDDYRYSNINLWDLRKSSTPVLTFYGLHKAGIVSLSWSTFDSALLLSASEEGKIICWNMNTEEALGESSVEGIQKIQWSPTLKGIYQTLNKNGGINIFTHHDSLQSRIDQKVRHPEEIPPEWLKRRCGVAFGYSGKLIHFNKQRISLSRVLGNNYLHGDAHDYDEMMKKKRTRKLICHKFHMMKKIL